ncbi:MAG: translocation/assembly module TamB domain-containing protein, partial [Stappiaceae bacterium]
DLSKATLTHQSLSAALAEPAQIAITEGVAEIRKARWKTGSGSVGITGRSDDTVDVKVQNFPLNLINAFSPGLGLKGQLSGDTSVELATGEPVVKWDISVAGASVPAAANNGVTPLGVKSTGSFADGKVEYKAAITNSQSINVAITGTANTQGPDVDAKVKGQIPLNIVDRVPALAARGIGLTGTLVADLSVKGGAPMPAIAGTLSIAGGTFRDAKDGISISALTLNANINKTTLKIQTLSGKVNEAGSLNVAGSLELDPARYFPADLTIKMTDGRFVDEQLLSTTFSADLTVKGPVATTPALAGRVDIKRMDIQIPDLLPGGYSDIKINHVNAPAAVVKQDREISGDDGSAQTGPPFNARLNLTVSAPARIFVRGRGLDAEMGGEIRISGTTNVPIIVGGFSMRRGRLGIFGKNLVFERGEVTFSGDLDPELDFVTTTNAADTTISIRVAGMASNPNFSFSSSPELPQDEVLALLLFNRSLDQLSTAQIASLAAQVAALTGSGPGILGSVRQSLGVDVLDLTTDEAGNAAVEAGKYINDNIYLGVKQAGESSSVTVDIDITKNLKGRGEVDARGDSKLGFEFNYDY